MSTTVLRGGDLVDGRGGEPRPGVDVVVADGMVREIVPSRPARDYTATSVVDVAGMLVVPGLINNHTHGTAFGPLFPSGHEGLAPERVLANLDRHLAEGTTTVLCVDGFVTEEALARTDDAHPVHVKLASCNTPACLRAATIADGGGLADEHRRFTACSAVRAGASRWGRSARGTPWAVAARATSTSRPRWRGGPG